MHYWFILGRGCVPGFFMKQIREKSVIMGNTIWDIHGDLCDIGSMDVCS